jgi:glycosyltransferase involved in cell wall biosynthesis
VGLEPRIRRRTGLNHPARLLSVLHVNDCGKVASTLVTTATDQGLAWSQYWPAQRRPSKLTTLAARALELPEFRRQSRNYDLVHVHYGLASYLPLLSNVGEFIVHLHGTDIRSDFTSSRFRHRIIAAGLRKASAVIYSTPDLKEFVQPHRSDATWLPNPVAISAFRKIQQGRRGRRVLIASRWQHVKGTSALLKVARELLRQKPSVDVVGLNWGPEAALAESAGVQMHPMVAKHEFPNFLSSFDVVVGQASSGAFGVTELEAMAAGVPLVGHYSFRGEYATAPPFQSCAPDDFGEAVLAKLEDVNCFDAAEHLQRWVRENHGEREVLARLISIYSCRARS